MKRMGKTIVSVKEAARLRHCTMKYIRDLLAEDRLLGAKKIGRQWQIPVDALVGKKDDNE